MSFTVRSILMIISLIIQAGIAGFVAYFLAKQLKDSLPNRWVLAFVVTAVGILVANIFSMVFNFVIGSKPRLGLWFVPFIGNISTIFNLLSNLWWDIRYIFNYFGFDYIIWVLADIVSLFKQVICLAIVPFIATRKELAPSAAAVSASTARAFKPKMARKILACRGCGCQVSETDNVCAVCGTNLIENKPFEIQ